VTLAQIGPVITTHPEAGGGGLPPTPPRGKVLELLSAFKDLHREAVEQAETVDALKARVRELEARPAAPADDTEIKSARAEVAQARAEFERVRDQLAKDKRTFDHLLRSLHEELKLKSGLARDMAQDIITLIDKFDARLALPDIPAIKHVPEHTTTAMTSAPPPTLAEPPRKRAPRATTTPPIAAVADAAKRRDLRTTILTVLAQRGGTLPKRKVLIYGRYSRSGATDKMFAELMAGGFIEPVAEGVRITTAGRLEVGVTSPLDPVVHDMPTMERAFLAVLHCYGELSKKDVLLYAGYARSGATDSAFANLSANDWIEDVERGRSIHITQDGIDALGPHDPPPTGKALRDRIRATLNTQAAKIFDALCHAHYAVPNLYVSKKQVLADIGYARSGATDAAFAQLVQRDYAIKDRGGQIAINPGLFRHG